MPNYCNVTIVGHLTRDPEVKTFGSSQSLCTCGIAYTKSWKNKQSGQRQEKTTFVDFKVWGGSGERFAEWFTKGSPVLLVGELEQEEWQDKTSGQKRSKIVLNVNDYQNLRSKSDSVEREPEMATADAGDVPF